MAKAERKRLQIEHAPDLSPGAKLIKLADKICNVRDATHCPPNDWSLDRRAEYLEWSRQVVAGCRGVNVALERLFDEVFSAEIATVSGACGEIGGRATSRPSGSI